MKPTYLSARFIFLRALGLIFFSAFYSMACQIHGLIGLHGILPAAGYLKAVATAAPGLSRFYDVPTLLWLNPGDAALTALSWAGMAFSILLALNFWPRAMIAACWVLFLSFISAAQDFSSYQSDGMLLEAAFLSLFFAPRGFFPGLGAGDAPSAWSLFLLRWEWFRIYFESGVVKLASGDPQWRHLTAMDHYYENGPLPTWIGWYAQQLPHFFHAGVALLTLVTELLIVWTAWLPRRWKIACFLLTTALQIGIILTANYAFLNYLVLFLGFLLLDDAVFERLGIRLKKPVSAPDVAKWKTLGARLALGWIFYATLVEFIPWPLVSIGIPLLQEPAELLAPFRIANAYGLFAVMTTARYEIEFQGSADGKSWTPYPFQYKPQDPARAPGIFAPYQPRFDWNLWFASLGSWRQNPWVLNVEARLLEGSQETLSLFAANPFSGHPPREVRAVLWQYWFTDRETRHSTGHWWKRAEIGEYAPTLQRDSGLRQSPGVVFGHGTR